MRARLFECMCMHELCMFRIHACFCMHERLCLWMYVLMYVCMNIYMYACLWTFSKWSHNNHTCPYFLRSYLIQCTYFLKPYAYAWMFVYVCEECKHLCSCGCHEHLCVWMYVLMYVCMNECMHVYELSLDEVINVIHARTSWDHMERIVEYVLKVQHNPSIWFTRITWKASKKIQKTH